MIGAVGAVDSRRLLALYAANVAKMQTLAAVTGAAATAARRPVAGIGTDLFVPSGPTAAVAPTYDRFGLLGGPAARPAVALSATRPQASGGPVGYTPAQIARAYGFGRTGLTGAGQTIAIVTAFNPATLAGDVTGFDSAFGLPAPSLRVVNPTGGAPAGPTDAGWALETALDVEWAHAVAPGAGLLVVQANSATVSDLTSAIDYARHQPGVSVVSMSFGATEFPQELRYNALLTTPPGHAGITFVAGSGDGGAGTLWPAVSPDVLSVGGTALLTGPGGAYAGEVGWPGSGGGVSLFQTEPAYQLGVQTTGRRTTPDVAYDAAPQTGFAVYQGGAWQTVGGTSAGAPQWAGLLALTDQRRARLGLGPLNQAQARLYDVPSADFHDVVFGSNGYFASVGYDYVTGLGSPVANRLLSDLAAPLTPVRLRLPLDLRPVSIAALLSPAPRGLV